MIGGIVGAVLGLAMLFLGLAFLMQDRAERKKQTVENAIDEQKQQAAQEERSIVAEQEEQEQTASIESEAKTDALQPASSDDASVVPAVKTGNLRRLKMGVQLFSQGVLLLVIAVICFVVDAKWINLPWYIGVPVCVAYTFICLIADAYSMGKAKEEEGAQETLQTSDADAAKEQKESESPTQDEE